MVEYWNDGMAPFGQYVRPPGAGEREPRRRRLNNCPQDTASVFHFSFFVFHFYFIFVVPYSRAGSWYVAKNKKKRGILNYFSIYFKI
jgi:hypothetical protein